MTPRLEEIAHDRLAPRSTEARQLAEVLAVCGPRHDPGELIRIGRLEEEHFVRALRELEEARVVDGSLRVAPPIRTVLAEGAPRAAVRVLHGRAIREATARVERGEADHAPIARHLLGSSDPGGVQG